MSKVLFTGKKVLDEEHSDIIKAKDKTSEIQAKLIGQENKPKKSS